MIVTTQLKVPAFGPLGVTVHVPPGVMTAPVLIENAIVIDPPPPVAGVKALPVTVTWTPLGPWPGVSAIDGDLNEVTVNGACAESKLPSDPVAVTV